MKIPTHEANIYLEAKGTLNDLQIVREIFCEDVYRVKEHLKNETKVIVDIGANVGVFSRLCHNFAPNAQIYAVEPEPTNLSYLKQNTVDKITIVDKAMSDTRGKARISNDGGGSRLGAKGWEVDVITFMDLGLGEIDILKLDCEGSEWTVLRGIPKSQMQRINYITIEYDAHLPEIVGKLAETHSVTTLGDKGGYCFAKRY